MKQGWELKKLGEICKISTGKSNTEDATENGEFAFFDRSKVVKKSLKYLFDCEAIIIAGEGQTFIPKFYSGKFDLHQRAYSIYNFDKRVNINFVYKYLIHFHKYFEEVAVGATAKSLRLRHFDELPIPIPPLYEQNHIVDILDEVFSAIAKAKENTEQNFKNAKELFESYLQGVFENKDEDWESVQLSKLCLPDRIITYGVIKLGNEMNDGVPCLRTSNVRWLRIDVTGIKRISPKLSEEYSRTILKGNEVLVNVRGTLGGVAVTPEAMKGWNVSREVAVVPVDNSKIVPSFLSFFIGSPIAQKWLGSVKKGAAYVGINIEDLRQLPISFPKIEEQQEIIKKINVVLAETKKLEAVYQTKINNLEELKKSILQKAFTGELTKSEVAIA